jgi:pyruvate dehydrogenase (quinone)
MLGIRYPMDVNLVGDSAETLRALLPRLTPKADRSWREMLEREVGKWWELMDRRAQQPAEPINPQLVFAELSKRLPDGAILASDSGSAANWYARQIRIRRGMKAMLSGNLATMVPGVPYAIAAKFAFPDRVSVAMVGDGAMQMGGMAEMLTAAKYYDTWADPRMIVLVLTNEDLNQVTWEQRVMEGDPQFKASQEIPYVDYAAWADLIGLHGIKITKAAEIEDAWREALSADRPVIISALTDPNEAPLPPHITFEQAERFAKSILADPHGGLPGAVESVREKVHEFLPGR